MQCEMQIHYECGQVESLGQNTTAGSKFPLQNKSKRTNEVPVFTIYNITHYICNLLCIFCRKF